MIVQAALVYVILWIAFALLIEGAREALGPRSRFTLFSIFSAIVR